MPLLFSRNPQQPIVDSAPTSKSKHVKALHTEAHDRDKYWVPGRSGPDGKLTPEGEKWCDRLMTIRVRVLSETLGDPALIVQAKDLHKFLGIKMPLHSWVKYIINNCGYFDSIDFMSTVKQGNGPMPKKKWQGIAFSIQTAREIAMITGGEKGRRARAFLLSYEEFAVTRYASYIPINQIDIRKATEDSLFTNHRLEKQ